MKKTEEDEVEGDGGQDKRGEERDEKRKKREGTKATEGGES